MKIKIMLVDDHKMVNEVLSALLAKEPDMEVVAIADNGMEAISMAREVRPDIIVMDVTMPVMNGLEACRRIMAETPESKIIVLSMHSEREYVVEALRSGAKGYIPKMSAFKTLVGAIRSVQENNGFLDPIITGIVLEDYNAHLNEPSVPLKQSPLSSREREVLQMITNGKNTRDIAFTLNVSPKTVETHRRQIMQKLKLTNVAELTKYAIREGFSSL
ncbi:MAG: response regulator transcription factor [Geobacteraceae bacterium]|jgi:DNA-binding NarL/FixJ family response regulator